MSNENPVKTFILYAIKEGFPSLVTLRFSGPVDWNLNGTWVRDLELKVTPPYSVPIDDTVLERGLLDIWQYGLRPLSMITAVPYENLADYEEFAEAADDLKAKLMDSVLANPYMSTHRVEMNGVSITAELTFKP